MSEPGLLILLFTVAFAMLIGEIFVPSHGILTVVGLGFLVTAVMKTFSYGGRNAGVTSIVICAITLPTIAYVSIKYWPHTWIGKRISPPNPVLTDADPDDPIEQLRALVGQTGQTVSPLRPVGTCEFDGRRVSCVAEMGVVDAGVTVVATGVQSGILGVKPKSA